MTDRELKTGNVLLCDDIRREMNGKLILIGVYPDHIVVASFPATLKLQFYIEYLPESIGQKTLFFRLANTSEDSDDKGEVIIQAGIEVTGPTTVAAIDLPSLAVTLKRPSTIELSISPDGDNWRVLSLKKVILGNVPGKVPLLQLDEPPPAPT